MLDIEIQAENDVEEARRGLEMVQDATGALETLVKETRGQLRAGEVREARTEHKLHETQGKLIDRESELSSKHCLIATLEKQLAALQIELTHSQNTHSQKRETKEAEGEELRHAMATSANSPQGRGELRHAMATALEATGAAEAARTRAEAAEKELAALRCRIPAASGTQEEGNAWKDEKAELEASNRWLNEELDELREVLAELRLEGDSRHRDQVRITVGGGGLAGRAQRGG